MKKNITILCFIILVFTAPLNKSHADDSVLDMTIEPFFNALKAGDIEVLKAYAGGILYQNITEASEQNKDYDSFLRQRYAKAIFHPNIVQQDTNKMVVSVNVDFQGKGTSVFELIVQKNSMGIWDIVEQYSPTGKP